MIGYKGNPSTSAGAWHALTILQKKPDTWQSYLRRLGSGINGVSERSKTLTEKDIIANAEHYMQKRYPGSYRVESYYNADKMKYDLRLKFDDPKQETMWLLRWSA